MAAIRISAIEGGSIGPLLGPFTIESDDDKQGALVDSVVRFNRWVASRMTFYKSKGGIENSSLFKSYTMECFEELSHDDPQAAEGLTGLVVNCFDLPARLREDPMWRLHRAILATLPGVTFME